MSGIAMPTFPGRSGIEQLDALFREAEAEETVIESARHVGGWIPACDILPDKMEEVLATDGEHHFVAHVDEIGRWWLHLNRTVPAADGFITDWQPLPLLPLPRPPEA